MPKLRCGLLIVMLGALALAGTLDAAGPELPMAPVSELPRAIRDAPKEVRDAYRFAVANRDLLRQIPCYCSCETWRHTSNYDCYVEDDSPGKPITFSYHGLG
ncbi:MAG: hypothetical protein Kow0092_31850 [Deferrisomatales bacterium]